MTDIRIIYGTNPVEMTIGILKDAELGARLRSGMHVVIKPNLVVAKPASSGATTHPAIVEGIVIYLKEHGINAPIIAEGAWVGQETGQAFDCCGYTDLAKRYGLKLIDTKKDKTVSRKFEDIETPVCETFFKADFLINVPVLKGHCQTTVTCCLKNLKGCIPDAEKRRFHALGLHRPIAALNMMLKPDLHVVDGICGDPSFEEGGNPVASHQILLSDDPVLLDSFASTLLGYAPDEVEYVRLAAEWGRGRLFDEKTMLLELDRKKRPKTQPVAGRSLHRLTSMVEEDGACSACYAALIYALSKVETKKVRGKIKIGQGFRNKFCEGWGVGDCTKSCDVSVPGCPVRAEDIIRFFEKEKGMENER